MPEPVRRTADWSPAVGGCCVPPPAPPTLAAARERAYGLLAEIRLPDSHHRTDIALAASEGRIRTPSLTGR